MIRRSIAYYNTLNENRSAPEHSLYAEFGKRLQSAYEAKGWSQSELARRASKFLPTPAKDQVQGHAVGRDLISNYVRGKFLPRTPVLKAIAKALKMKPSDLLPPDFVPSVDKPVAMETSSIDGKHIVMKLHETVTFETYAAIIALIHKDRAKQ